MDASRLRLLLLDMDGTLTTVVSPWQYVHEELRIWEPHGKCLLDAFLGRTISFLEFCERDAQLWSDRGIRLETVNAILDTIPVPQQAVEFLQAAHKSGLTLAIISSGFARTADRIRSLAGLAQDELFVASNDLRQEPDGAIRPILRVGDGTDIPGKAFWASHVLHTFGATRDEVGAIGDTSSDRPLFMASSKWSQIAGPQDLADIPWLPFSVGPVAPLPVHSDADSSGTD